MRSQAPFLSAISILLAASAAACTGDDTAGPPPDAGSADSGGDSSVHADGATDSSPGDATPATDAPADGATASLTGIKHVLLLSIDGLHQVDLANFIASHPGSTLAKLGGTGVEYSSAYVNRLDGTPTNPSDSFPGLLALVTGGSSKSHGGWYDVSYARDLYPAPNKGGIAAAPCTAPVGAEAEYDESIELDNTHLWGSATDDHPTHDIHVARSRIDLNALPYAKSGSDCTPVYAHQYIRVNTIFNVAHAANLHTAWSDKHLAYEMVSGPSGDGIDDFFSPEINSDAANLPGTGVDAGTGADFTTLWTYAEVYDDYKVAAIVREIDGHWSDYGLAGAVDPGDAGSVDPGVPAIFGMNFQALSVAQKSVSGGYTDANGTPSTQVEDALVHTDASIGSMVAELTAKGLLDSTLIIVAAKHGQSPIDNTLTQRVDPDALASVINGSAPVADHIEDDVALYWLKDATTAGAAGAAATTASTVDGGAFSALVDTAYTSTSPNFIAMFGDPTTDPHTPDLILKSQHGVIYSLSKKKWAEHGGFADDDSHVGLLVSNPALRGATVTTDVRTKQIGPTILKALGLDPAQLQAAVAESTDVLPGVAW